MGRQYQITKSLLYDDSVKGTVCAELNICIYRNASTANYLSFLPTSNVISQNILAACIGEKKKFSRNSIKFQIEIYILETLLHSKLNTFCLMS